MSVQQRCLPQVVLSKSFVAKTHGNEAGLY